MAKRRPSQSLEEKEDMAGFKADALPQLSEDEPCFYSDLQIVPRDLGRRMSREVDETRRRQARYGDQICERESSGYRLSPKCSLITGLGETEIELKRLRGMGHYRYLLDLRYSFGLAVRVLLKEEEAEQVTALQKSQAEVQGSQSSILFSLPPEIRDKIYDLVSSEVDGDNHTFYHFTVVDDNAAIQSLTITDSLHRSGNLRPLRLAGQDIRILQVCRQLREEALPWVYRNARLPFASLEETLKLLLLIGDVGCSNIQRLRLDWFNLWDSEKLENEHRNDPRLSLCTLAWPYTTTDPCVRLIHQCHRLRHISIRFDDDWLLRVPEQDFKQDTRIRGLCALRGIQEVEILGLDFQPIEEDCPLAQWLSDQLIGANKKDV
ncbi:hypothetical protein F4780DRAFT_759181 [Xylariomycetidae sp. FL0641]|nr:hypothetical protein F4780DRAFT_759181 [Xylariomycetidae sp. FL0641]